MVALLMAGGADPSIENDDVIEIEIPEADDMVNETKENVEPKESVSKESVSATSDEKDKDTVEEGESEPVEKEETDKSDGEEEKRVTRPNRGMVPADFADNNEKVCTLHATIFYYNPISYILCVKKNTNTVNPLS